MVVRVALVAVVAHDVDLVRLRGGRAGGRAAALADAAPLEAGRDDAVQVVQPPPEEPLLAHQLLLDHEALAVPLLQRLDEDFGLVEQA